MVRVAVVDRMWVTRWSRNCNCDYLLSQVFRFANCKLCQYIEIGWTLTESVIRFRNV